MVNTPVIPNAIGIDVAYNEIQELMASIDWIERSYGKAKTITEDREGSSYTLPKVYNAKREYIPLEPDDRVKAFSFLQAYNESTFSEYNPHLNTYIRSQNISVIVWANLEKISNTLDYNFEENLIQEVMSVLNKSQNINAINSIDITIPNVWTDYSYSRFSNEFYKENFTTFKINMTITVNDRCFQGNSFNNINC